MNFISRFLLVPGAALAFSSLVVACGGGDGDAVEMDQWVADVCDLALDYKPELDALDAEFDSVEPETDTVAGHEKLIELLEKARDIQDDLVGEFKKLGKPDIEDGEAVVAAFVDNFEEEGAELDRIIAEMKKLDPESDEYFFALLAVFFSAQESESVRDRLDTLAQDNQDVEDLIAAFEADPECARIVFDLDDDLGDFEEDLEDDVGQEQSSAIATEEWVAGFCTAFVTFVDDLMAISDDLTMQDVNDLEAAKDVLVAAFEDARDRSMDLELDILLLGQPDVPDGAQVQAAIELGVSDIVAIFDAAVADAEALSTTDPAVFLSEVEDLATRFEAAFDEIGASFDALDIYDTSEIDQIADSLPECAALG